MPRAAFLDREIVLGIRPECIAEGERRFGAEPETTLPVSAKVDMIEPTGAETIVLLRLGGVPALARVAADIRPPPGAARAIRARHPRHLPVRPEDGTPHRMTETIYAGLADRVVLITGGASGIGAAFVRAFAAQRARVAFLDIDTEAAEALVRELENRPRFFPCDLLDIDALGRAIEGVKATLGNISVLINNAANDQRHALAEVTSETFDWTMGVNFKHVFFAAQAVVPQMQALGGGSIVNMSSVAWIRGAPMLPTYAAAKAAIVGFTNSLARLVGPDRIRVNAIAPGMVITERQRRLWFQDEERIAEGRARQAIRDAVTPEDIARLALFLASDESARITRQCIRVDGGLA